MDSDVQGVKGLDQHTAAEEVKPDDPSSSDSSSRRRILRWIRMDSYMWDEV